jgi:hypothetical protein
MKVEDTRSPEGLIIRGRVLRWGEMPPAAGPARTQWCLEHGLTSLMNSRKNYGIALRKVIAHLPGGTADLPPVYPLHELHTENAALDTGRARVKLWFSLRNRLDKRDEIMRSCGREIFGASWQAAEEACRLALQSAADAFNWLDDARQDLGQEQLVDIRSFTGRSGDPCPAGDLVDQAHAAVHTCGEIVGGLFGCKVAYRDGRWYDECIVTLLHLRFGNSAGLRVRYECSICRQDPGDCEHEPGATYSAQAALAGDSACTICSEAGCSVHLPGDTYDIVAIAKLSNPQLREVSLTPRPRDPLARIAGRSVEDEDLRDRLGRLPLPGEMVLDHSCMYPCMGFKEFPE